VRNELVSSFAAANSWGNSELEIVSSR